jgi:hypothetical protein
MAFIPLKNFLSIWHLKLIGLIGPRAVSERVKLYYHAGLASTVRRTRSNYQKHVEMFPDT